MTKSVIQPLESYRLAQYAVPVPCYICGSENTFDSEFCAHCLAPLALAHQANSQGAMPRMIAVIGASAVGKTVYLGVLMDMLSRLPDRMQILARGAFSITLQQTTLSALSRCRFPQKTPNDPDQWNWVHCQIRGGTKHGSFELILPDMAGEAVLQEVEHPHTYRVVREFLRKCDGVLLLVDALKIAEGGRDQEHFTMKLISYFSELEKDTKYGWEEQPVAVVFTKSDLCPECADDPNNFAQQQAAGLWQQCKQRFNRYRFFAAGVAGTCVSCEQRGEGRVNVPLRIEPHGIIEPFEWLLKNTLV
ncbi:MAG: GTPase domain-containing protein [Pirellulales bacterium]|nr:GTPase domain-containing protein [Pirellulales bacterium]